MIYFRNSFSTSPSPSMNNHPEDSTTTTQNNLQGVSTFYAFITSEPTSTLSKKLPHLVSLELSNCSLILNKYKSAELDLQNWKHLDTLIIDQVDIVGKEIGLYYYVMLEYVSLRGSSGSNHKYLDLTKTLHLKLQLRSFIKAKYLPHLI